MRGIDLRAVTARCTLEKKEAVRSGAPEERASERGREKAREEEEEDVEEEVAGAEQRGRRQEEAEEASAMAVAMASTAQQTLQCKCGLQNTQEKREEEGTQGDGRSGQDRASQSENPKPFPLPKLHSSTGLNLLPFTQPGPGRVRSLQSVMDEGYCYSRAG
jgi:hypothetical protein